MKRLFFFCLFFLLTTSALMGMTLKTSLSSKEIRIGDTILFKAEVDTFFDKISFAPSRYGFTILSKKMNRQKENTTLSYLMSIYGTGKFILPALRFKIGNKYLQSDTIMVFVIPLTTASDTKVLGIKDIWQIKGSYLIYFLIPLIIVILFAVFILFLNKRRKKKQKNAYEKSQEELNKLLTNFNSLYSSGRLKDIAIISTRALKRYYSYIFSKNVFDLTSKELIKFMNGKIDEETRSRLKEILRQFDLIKFAKRSLDYDSTYTNITAIIDIINRDFKERFINVK